MSKACLVLLCVEDDPDVRHIIRLSLDLDSQIETEFAVDATEAWQRFTTGRAFDLILLDDQLPDCSGMELAAKICRGDHRVPPPIAFLTGACSEGDISRFHAAGAVGVIFKPFDPLTLSVQVRALLASKTDFFVSL